MTDAQIGILVALGLGLVFLLILLRRPAGAPLVEAQLKQVGSTLSEVENRLDAQEKGLTEANHGLAQVRQIISGLPTQRTVHQLELEIASLKGSVQSIDRQTLATQRMVETIDRHLRKDDL